MNQYYCVELANTKPLYSVFAKTEKQVVSKLRKYLTKVGEIEIELVGILD